ncbi:hypothetical protein [Paraburkholderia sp. BCC1885]|uniref:hypothetical protein n=1 Tax=Paraburkholderia sp. BCC1885 TaxID=2562669 RepID=UPI0011821A0B|nr:hypothetical protein [Paraburkholderia sp. BCC1885]
MPHYEIEFRNANDLALHKVGSYNRFHWLSQFGNFRMSPPPSSYGGLNPNRSFGFFFARAPNPAWPLQILTSAQNFLYNPRLFRIRARGGRTGRACTRLDAHITSRKKHWAQQLFLDRS